MRTLQTILFFLLTQTCTAGTFNVLESQPQDPKIFTQGLELLGDELYVSSGLYGKSFITKESLSADTQLKQALDPKLFAEGLTLVNDTLYLLTWRAGLLLSYNRHSFELIDSQRYDGEGWGLTHDGTQFLMSDGSHYIQFRNTADFSRSKFLRITHDGKPLSKLNELEYSQDALWANVWFSDTIYKIDPATGRTLDSWDLSSLRTSLGAPTINNDNVLNGIAYDKSQNAFWVTGKRWPKRYLIRLESNSAAPTQ